MMRRFVAPFGIALVVSGSSIALVAQDQDKEVPNEVRDALLAPVVKGSGVTYFAFTPSNTGRVAQITSPAGVNHLFSSTGNYDLCTGTGDYRGSVHFTQTALSQPNGPGTLPLSITAKTADNQWQIKWSYAFNQTDVELLVTAALKKLGSGTHYAHLGIRGDFDISGNAGENRGVRSTGTSVGTSTWLSYTHALTMLAHTRSHTNSGFLHTTYGGGNCFPDSVGVTATGDLGMSMYYYNNSLASGATKTVKFQIRRQ